MPSQNARARGRPRSFHDTSDAMIVQSLDRAMSLLKIVANGDGMSLTEIAEAAGASAATVYRALITLQKHSIAEFDEARQLWYVGIEAFRVGSAFLGRTNIAEQSRPVMQQLMAETGETANLGIVEGGNVVFLSQVETHEPIRAFFRPGSHGAIHASGIGKVLLAYMPEAPAGALIEKLHLERFTENTIVDKEPLLRQMKTIREWGYSVDGEERTIGMRCIAAPIFNSFGEAAAGVSVSGPEVRMKRENDGNTGMIVRAAADRITVATGGRLPRETP